MAGLYHNGSQLTVGGGNSWEGGFWGVLHGGPSTGVTNASHRFFMAMVCRRRDPATGNMVEFETANQKKVREAGQAFRIFRPVMRRDHEGNVYSLNKGFLEEYLHFPFSAKKDLIDAASRLYDLDPVPPIIVDQGALEPETYVDG